MGAAARPQAPRPEDETMLMLALLAAAAAHTAPIPTVAGMAPDEAAELCHAAFTGPAERAGANLASYLPYASKAERRELTLFCIGYGHGRVDAFREAEAIVRR